MDKGTSHPDKSCIFVKIILVEKVLRRLHCKAVLLYVNISEGWTEHQRASSFLCRTDVDCLFYGLQQFNLKRKIVSEYFMDALHHMSAAQTFHFLPPSLTPNLPFIPDESESGQKKLYIKIKSIAEKTDNKQQDARLIPTREIFFSYISSKTFHITLFQP